MATRNFTLTALLMLLGLGLALSALFAPAPGAPWIKPRRSMALPQDPVPMAALDATKLARLTGVSLGSGRRPAPARPSEPTKLPLRARGTLLGAPEDWAAIENTETGKMNSYAVGDWVLDARVVEISRSLVTLSEGPRCECSPDCPPPRMTYLEVSGLGRTPAVPPPPPREVSPRQFDLSRREVEHELSDMNELVSSMRIVPSGKGGFKIFAIRPGSFAEKVGMKNGDRLIKVNGTELSNPETVLSMYSDLRTAPHIDLDIERDGTMVRQSYNLQ